MHIINYKDLDSYKQLIRLIPETTGSGQIKNGTIRFSTKDYDFIYYSSGVLKKRDPKSSGTGQTLTDTGDVSGRSVEHYNKVFNIIANNVLGIKRKITSWDEQLFSASPYKVITAIFKHENIAQNISKNFKPGDDPLKILHRALKDYNVLIKGIDYE